MLDTSPRPRIPTARSICVIILLVILGILLLIAPLGHAGPHMTALPETQMTAMPETNHSDPNRKCDDTGSMSGTEQLRRDHPSVTQLDKPRLH